MYIYGPQGPTQAIMSIISLPLNAPGRNEWLSLSDISRKMTSTSHEAYVRRLLACFTHINVFTSCNTFSRIENM